LNLLKYDLDDYVFDGDYGQQIANFIYYALLARGFVLVARNRRPFIETLVASTTHHLFSIKKIGRSSGSSL